MVSLAYNGKSFTQRPKDGFVNLGELCATHGKKYANWSRLESSQEYLEALAETLTESESQIWSSDKLVTPGFDAIGGRSGTWGHPLVALEVARWINPKFGVWCNIHIKTLIETGTTSIKDNWNDPQWLEIRSKGKKKRLTLTDEVKAYIERHPELSEKEKKYLFASHSNALNRGVYGRDAKTLKATLGLKGHHLLRDYFDEDENAAIQDVEHITAWWIQTKDMHPVTAIIEIIKLIEYSLRFEDRHQEKVLIKSTKKTKKLQEILKRAASPELLLPKIRLSNKAELAFLICTGRGHLLDKHDESDLSYAISGYVAAIKNDKDHPLIKLPPEFVIEWINTQVIYWGFIDNQFEVDWYILHLFICECIKAAYYNKHPTLWDEEKEGCLKNEGWVINHMRRHFSTIA